MSVTYRQENVFLNMLLHLKLQYKMIIVCHTFGIPISCQTTVFHIVKPQYNEGPRDWQNTFPIRFCCIKVTFPNILLLLGQIIKDC